jgi:hypothetical protein
MELPYLQNDNDTLSFSGAEIRKNGAAGLKIAAEINGG